MSDPGAGGEQEAICIKRYDARSRPVLKSFSLEMSFQPTCEVPPVSWVASSHHVLRIEHLLCKLRHCQSSVLLAASCCERGKSRHEEVKAREGDHVDGQLAKVGVQLTGEPQASGDA